MTSSCRIVMWQLVATGTLVAVLFLWEISRGPWWGLEQTVSALAAGIASVVPAAFYAWRASVERSATRFLLQGVLKFALTIVLIAVCIILVKPAAAGFFGTLILLQVMYVVAPLVEAHGSE